MNEPEGVEMKDQSVLTFYLMIFDHICDVPLSPPHTDHQNEMFHRHAKSTNRLSKRLGYVWHASLKRYYTLRMSYLHNNLLIFSRFQLLLSLTLVRHQYAEMKVSRQLMGHFHRQDTQFSSECSWFHHFMNSIKQQKGIKHFIACLCFSLLHVWSVNCVSVNA